MPRKVADVNDMSLEELDEVLQSQPAAAQDDTTPSSGNPVVSFLVALFVSALPVYLFTTPMFDLDLEANAVALGAGALVAAVLLTLAYKRTAEKEVRRLSAKARSRPARRAPTSKKGGKTEEVNEGASITSQAVNWSLFYNNFVFLAVFVMVALNIIPAAVPADITFVVSVVGSAAMVRFLFA